MTEEGRNEIIKKLEAMSKETYREHLLLSIKKNDELLEMWIQPELLDVETKENLFKYAIYHEAVKLIETLIAKGIKPTKGNKEYALSCICKWSAESQKRTEKIYHMIKEAAES